MSTPHNISLLAFPNGQLLDITGPLQMFAGANDELSRRVYHMGIAAPEAVPFATSSGVRLVANMAFAQVTNRRLARTDTLMTVGGEPGMRHELARGSVTEIVSRAIGRVPRMASVCSGTFFLAAAGTATLLRATKVSLSRIEHCGKTVHRKIATEILGVVRETLTTSATHVRALQAEQSKMRNAGRSPKRGMKPARSASSPHVSHF